ncbi:MAG: hypothetical protein QGH51_02330 [Planctomycetota bacterium]|jgi:hypothetical protein|nr:hypothetical protein [Planctomycetota bacterium]MDP6940840.1 hypothetical protein [Planctomycetota bacterium]
MRIPITLVAALLPVIPRMAQGEHYQTDLLQSATLPLVALRARKPLIVLNLQATDYDPFASQVLRGPSGDLFPAICG